MSKINIFGIRSATTIWNAVKKRMSNYLGVINPETDGTVQEQLDQVAMAVTERAVGDVTIEVNNGIPRIYYEEG